VASKTDSPPPPPSGSSREPPADWPVFAITAATVLGVCALVFVAPQQAGVVIIRLYDLLTKNLGFLYQSGSAARTPGLTTAP